MTKREKWLLVALVLTVAVFSGFLWDARLEIEKLKRGQRGAAQAVVEVKNVVIEVSARPFRGAPSAKVAVVEFSDYQCPFSGQHMREVAPQIERDYVATGKIRYYFGDFPLEFHVQAQKAAEAAHCAGEQGKFWEMHDQLFANVETLSDLTGHARAVGLDVGRFEQCMQSGKYVQPIRDDKERARNAGIIGTPGFLLGVMDPKQPKVRVEKRISGVGSYATFRRAIESLLGAQK